MQTHHPKEIQMNRMIALLSLVFAMTLTVSAATTQPTREHLSKTQLSALIATAKTPAEHQRIADYYRAQSVDLLTQSEYHAQMAAGFKLNPSTNNDKFQRQTVNHCAYLAQSLKTQSVKAEALAKQHEEMATAAEQK
jgi:hypothetical protein